MNCSQTVDRKQGFLRWSGFLISTTRIPFSRSILLGFVLILLPKFCFAVPEPGIHSSGGLVSFSFIEKRLFKPDTIELIDEKVWIQVYQGFAVVRAEYRIANLSDDTLEIDGWMPAHNCERAQSGFFGCCEICFHDSTQFAVYQDSEECEVLRVPRSMSESYSPVTKWNYWQNKISPNSETVVSIYSIVETCGSLIIDGWSQSNENILVYHNIPNSIPTFNSHPIMYVIQLMDNLNLDDVWGANPQVGYVDISNQLIIYHISPDSSLSPRQALILCHKQETSTCKFLSAINNSELYFEKIRKFSQSSLTKKLTPHSFSNPFKFESSVDDPILQFGVFTLIVVTALVVGIVLLIINITKKKNVS